MKHTKFYGGLCALVMILLTSLSAAAQELTVKTVSFLKPGEKGVLAIGLKNAIEVDGFQAKIHLPEGISFVQSETNEKRCVINKTDRTQKGWSLFLQKAPENSAVMMCVGGSVKAGEGDVVTFDVMVDENYTGAKEINLDLIEISEKDGDLFKPAEVTGKVCSTEDQMLVNGTIAPLKVDEPQTVTINLDFEKVTMNAAAFFVELPQGLKYVEGSETAGPICGNHDAACKKGQFTLLWSDFSEDPTFLANKGELASFQVVADETFVSGSKIRISNVKATTYDENRKVVEYYAEDFDIEVTMDNATGINGIDAAAEGADGIYQINGVRTDKMQRGVNVVVKNGKAIKVVKK